MFGAMLGHFLTKNVLRHEKQWFSHLSIKHLLNVWENIDFLDFIKN